MSDQPKERGILFSGPMVRAILEGRKTQTRRIVKPFPSAVRVLGPYRGGDFDFIFNDGSGLLLKCPYGVPGDRLWVRETWAAPHACDHLRPREIVAGTRVHYTATEDLGGLLLRPSIFMPRWASRITLEVVSVRVERLQNLSEADAIAEGVRHWPDAPIPVRKWNNADNTPPPWHREDRWSVDRPESTDNCYSSARGCYGNLWESINGPGSWDANPWVWVIEFKRVTP